MVIECQDVSKIYIADGREVRAVDQVSLKVEAGDFVTILGHSGSGKTTLLSLIGGLTRPDSGKILINGHNSWIGDDREVSEIRNSTIGFVFQFASLVPTLTSLENLLLPLSFSTSKKEGREQALDLLEKVGLSDKANTFPSQLSGGQQRRISIARAFINKPDIILADEPTGDLDETTENEILDLFRSFNQQGITFVVVTHNRDLARSQVSARLLQMNHGKIEELAV